MLIACDWLSIESGRETGMHLVQEVDKPGHIITLEVAYTFRVLFPIKHIGKLVLKVEGRHFEVAKLLQNSGAW